MVGQGAQQPESGRLNLWEKEKGLPDQDSNLEQPG
jgi:hypothetical protein